MHRHNFQIARLISGYLSESLQPEEEQELQIWRDASPEHERLFQQICEKENITRYVQNSQKFNKNEGWSQVDKRIHRSISRKYYIKALSYAAAVLIPLIIGVAVITYQNDNKDSEIAEVIAPIESILPGERKAMLTLGSGEIIDLQDIESKEVSEADGTTIGIDAATLNYQSVKQKEKPKQVIYNKVDVPRGGEYSLFLADGTKVFLNAMSSLRFPVQFSGDTRTVELEGEAYFEVVPDGKPFIVAINEMQVEVLGTSFNVAAYAEEITRTTLVKGSVKVLAKESGISKVLKPSEQALFDTESDNFNITTVDVSLYTSWIEGKIYFKDERLEEIMKALSRWYDMEVIYKDEAAKNIRFGCNVDRYEDIKPFLELLEKTNKVKITKEDKKITIQSK